MLSSTEKAIKTFLVPKAKSLSFRCGTGATLRQYLPLRLLSHAKAAASRGCLRFRFELTE
jgi:hypothetical protein